VTHYILAFNRQASGDYSDFHSRLVGHSKIRRWWHFLPSAYIIGTNMSPSELSKHFKETADTFKLPKRHIVFRVDLRQRAGWLPAKAWDWMNRVETDADSDATTDWWG
jgi:hypothetical protein